MLSRFAAFRQAGDGLIVWWRLGFVRVISRKIVKGLQSVGTIENGLTSQRAIKGNAIKQKMARSILIVIF